MVPRSDIRNETRVSSEPENSPTPNKELQNRSRMAASKQRSLSEQQIHTSTDTNISQSSALTYRSQNNTPTSSNLRTTPNTHLYQQNNQKRFAQCFQRFKPPVQSKGILRPFSRRPPSAGMESKIAVNMTTPLGPLNGTKGFQRNSVAVVDNRDHIYEEMQGPPRLTPVSGVLQKGKSVIRPIAYRPVVSQGSIPLAPGNKINQNQRTPRTPSNPPNLCSANNFNSGHGQPNSRYLSNPTLSRDQIQHYGSLGDLKTLRQNSSPNTAIKGVDGLNSAVNYHCHYLGKDDNNTNADNCMKSSLSYNNNKNNKNNYNNNDNNNNNRNNNNNNTENAPNTKNNSYSKVSEYKTLNSTPTSVQINSTSNDTIPTCPVINNGTPNGDIRHSPPSHSLSSPQHSPCCNTEEGHSRYLHRSSPFGEGFSSTFDSLSSYENTSTHSTMFSRSTSRYECPPLRYHSGNGNSSDLMRYESLRNLSSRESHTQISHPRLNYGLHRMGGSFSNLARLGQHHPHHSGSFTGSNPCLDRSLLGSDTDVGLDTCDSGSIRGSLSELNINDHHQPSSLSDSCVMELEAMPTENGTEINSLKEETTKQDKEVLLKVYKEKEKTWEKELKKVRDLHKLRIERAQQREKSLSAQTYQLLQERNKVLAELDQVKQEREGERRQVEHLKKEVSSLRVQLEETKWGLCQKSGEISLLKTQLKDSQSDQTTRGHEILNLRAQVRQYQQEIERQRAEIAFIHDLTVQLRREITELRSQQNQSKLSQNQEQKAMEKSLSELETLRRESDTQRKSFEEERAKWVDEKERVIRYQKQLHHSYLSMLTRNRNLEEEITRLTGTPLTTLDSSKVCMMPPSLPSLSTSCFPSLSIISSISTNSREESLTINRDSEC